MCIIMIQCYIARVIMIYPPPYVYHNDTDDVGAATVKSPTPLNFILRNNEIIYYYTSLLRSVHIKIKGYTPLIKILVLTYHYIVTL